MAARSPGCGTATSSCSMPTPAVLDLHVSSFDLEGRGRRPRGDDSLVFFGTGRELFAASPVELSARRTRARAFSRPTASWSDLDD